MAIRTHALVVISVNSTNQASVLTIMFVASADTDESGDEVNAISADESGEEDDIGMFISVDEHYDVPLIGLKTLVKSNKSSASNKKTAKRQASSGMRLLKHSFPIL